MELALYCTSRAIESFFICVHKWGWLNTGTNTNTNGNACTFGACSNVHPLSNPLAHPSSPNSFPFSLALPLLFRRSTTPARPGAKEARPRVGAGVRTGAGLGIPWARGLGVSPGQMLDVCILSCAAAIIMHCYANEREVFRSKYLNVLDWVFGGPDGEHEGGTPLKGKKGTEGESEGA